MMKHHIPGRLKREVRRITVGLALATSVALIVTACSAPESDSTENAGRSREYANAVQIDAAVEAGFVGTSTEPPTSGPSPAADKNVWILSAFQQVRGLAVMTEEAQAAAAALGWTTDVCDGQNNAGGAWAACVRQAIAAGADAILLESIDCGAVKAPLQEARDAGIAIASSTSFDCDDPTQGGSAPLFDATVDFVEGASTPREYFESMGKLRADWVIQQTSGQAKVLQVKFDGVAFGEYLAKGFEEEFATCDGCKIVGTLALTPNDFPVMRQKFETALLQATDANAVSVDVDFMLAGGIQQALVAANRPDLVVAGGECGIENLDYIRAGGGQQMCIGSSLGHISYAAMDSLNRYFAGEGQVVQGLGWQLVDAERNLPPQGQDFDGPVDYVSAYKAIWN